MGKVKVDAYKCERCGHIWVPRDYSNEPKVCPKCKNPYWNTPRKKAKKLNSTKAEKKSDKP